MIPFLLALVGFSSGHFNQASEDLAAIEAAALSFVAKTDQVKMMPHLYLDRRVIKSFSSQEVVRTWSEKEASDLANVIQAMVSPTSMTANCRANTTCIDLPEGSRLLQVVEPTITGDSATILIGVAWPSSSGVNVPMVFNLSLRKVKGAWVVTKASEIEA